MQTETETWEYNLTWNCHLSRLFKYLEKLVFDKKIDKKVKTFINNLVELTKNPFLLTRLKWLALSLRRYEQF